MLVNIIYALAGLAALYVVATLVMGARAMGGKNEGARAASNKWMQRRVFGQFVAIALLFLAFYVKRNGG